MIVTLTHTDSGDIDYRLAQLGLKHTPIVEAVKRGYVAFISSTPNDPPLFPGFAAWAMVVRALREYLLPEGWQRSDENNYSLVVNSAGTVAIAVATGDDGTGDADEHPTTKSSKGPSTVEAVVSNQLKLDLGYEPPELPQPARPAAKEQRETWLLLVHRAQGEVRCELSLPTSMGSDGRVDGWQERIILSAIPTDPDIFGVATPSPPDQPDIDVAVKRRA